MLAPYQGENKPLGVLLLACLRPLTRKCFQVQGCAGGIGSKPKRSDQRNDTLGEGGKGLAPYLQWLVAGEFCVHALSVLTRVNREYTDAVG